MLYSEKWKKLHVVFLCIFILTDIIFLAAIILSFSMTTTTVDPAASGIDYLGEGMIEAFIGVVWVFFLILETVVFFCGRYLLRDQKYAFDLE